MCRVFSGAFDQAGRKLMIVLVFNCGSSSIKYQLFDMPSGRQLAGGGVSRIGEAESESSQKGERGEIRLLAPVKDHEQGLASIKAMLTDPDKGPIKTMSDIEACGHRVVHGGETFTGSVLIDDQVEAGIEAYADLAPLHNPPNLAGIREAKKMLPGVPQIACFDTAFHQTLPQTAYLYALPMAMYEQYKIRRYGFHGTSHRYVARRAAELMQRGKYEVSLITCHLGNGCSLAAVKNGKSVDTSMGLTPLQGLVMGTRSGDIDPAIVFYLHGKGYSAAQLDKLLNKESGLLGVSGLTNDEGDLEKAAVAGNERAQLALDIFAYRVRQYIGAYLAVLNGCDAIVMTGGIGERGTEMRQRILENMEDLGIILDADANARMFGKEGPIHAPTSTRKIFVIPTNEEAAIARDTCAIASGATG